MNRSDRSRLNCGSSFSPDKHKTAIMRALISALGTMTNDSHPMFHHIRIISLGVGVYLESLVTLRML